MVYSFYFLLVGSRRNEFNSLWGDKWGYVRSLLLARKVYHPEEKDDISSQYSSEFIVYNDSWRYHLISMTALRRQYQNKPQHSVSFPIPLQRLLHSFLLEPKQTKKETIPYPRCGFGACLRCGRAA